MAGDSRLLAGLLSLGSAALGYALLWLVLEGGKKVFGKKRVRLEEPTSFSWVRAGDDAEFVVGAERGLWSDHFARESDLMLMHCAEAQVDDRSFQNTTLQLRYNQLTIEGESFQLDEVDRITGVVRELQIPREAMGRGDLEFLARDRRFPRLARCALQHLRGIGPGLGGRPHEHVAWSARLVGNPVRNPSLPLALWSGCSLAGAWLPGMPGCSP